MLGQRGLAEPPSTSAAAVGVCSIPSASPLWEIGFPDATNFGEGENKVAAGCRAALEDPPCGAAGEPPYVAETGVEASQRRASVILIQINNGGVQIGKILNDADVRPAAMT
jgi:hypothetical protein